MKKRVLWLRYLFLFLAFAAGTVAYAQELTLTGKVTDAADGSTIPGATIVVKNTTTGTVTDIDGKYSLKVKSGDVIVISYVGYTTQEITVTNQKTLDIVLATGVKSLNEVVVIGYGTVKKGDATGAVTAIDKRDFNMGAISSPQQQIVGKIPGVQVTTVGGAPGGNATIRIRGGSSIRASNDPLIVIDGVPTDNSATTGSRGTLSMINPDEIETYTVLRDASATAIYGSRASNGVIMITTKKGKPGGKAFGVEYSGNVSLYAFPKTVSVLDGNEYRSLVEERYAGQQNVLGLLDTNSTTSTDWQKEIYRNTISTDHNIGFYGGPSYLPFRISIGYLFQDGVLITDNMQRTTLGANLSPTLFDNHLKINVNAKYMHENNTFADNGAIAGAIAFDPTKPVTATNNFGNYYAWLQPGDTLPVNQATTNPVALLNMREDKSKVNRVLGNVQLDYKLHFLPDLRANLNLGLDWSKSNGTVYVPADAPWVYLNGGTDNKYDQTKKNEVLDFYLNYVKEVKSIKSKFDVMAGYSWQYFYFESGNYNSNVAHTPALTDTLIKKKEYYLLSFYGRFNYTLANRYLLTFTLRDDGSSKFSPDTRWGLFPSVALAWKINDEAFLKDSKTISQLKLRLGWGVTGQQEITDFWYPYQAIFTAGDQYTQYQFGNYWYTTLRADAYDPNIKWEETTTFNVGIDYGFLNDRIVGGLDFYYRQTNDLINYIPVAAGSNLSNYVTTNIGDMENKGVEFSIDGKPIVTKDFTWDIGGNVAYNQNEITKLTAYDDPSYQGILTGNISGGVGNTVQVQTVGYPVNSFYVYQQVYDAAGKPIEGLYVDRNNDGKITDADRYHYKSANPDWTFGINTSLTYKKWSFATAGHASLGNYVYNNISANRGVYNNLYRPEGPYLGNVTSDVFDVNFNNQQYLSDYYVQNAAFFKLDYLSVGYVFENIIKNSTSKLRLSLTMNNVFTITGYKGIDPEINLQTSVGIDNNMYPRTKVFVLGVNLVF
jgi:TonB-dependent starch-binding outer membrane protein SusC